MNVAHLKVSTRLTVGFGVIIFFLVVIIAVALMKMASINEQLTSITDVNNVEVAHLSKMRGAVYEQSLIARNIALATDPVVISQNTELLKQQMAIYSDAEAKLDKMFSELPETTDAEKKSIAIIKEQSAKAMPALTQILGLGAAGKAEEIKAVLAAGLSAQQMQRRTTLTELARFEDKLNSDAALDAKATYTHARNMMLVLGALAIIIGVAGGVLITRSLLRQLGGEPAYVSSLALSIAKGDLTTKIDVSGSRPDSLMMSMKSMNDGLQQIVREVRAGTDSINTASSQIAAGNLDLSSRTEEQAGSLEETASAMEQLTSTVKQNADNAREANQLAATASNVALESGGIVQQVVDTMAAIDESSKKIVDIISVIDGIAFQTNILALNAAVEAARAGEQGRGFAVVASEVRSLAQRSSAAAKEIKLLIDNSVDKVSSGSKLVSQAGQSMENVVTSVRQVVDVIAGITEASREQSQGIDEINHAITQMDQVTQQNAALVEEAAAAAQSLQEQARKLSGVVDVFVTA
ncbi:methyl-accepting chemotaxis protein [Herbaspirillum rhizosphaerae]|uniref:Methyl-accepting chemotaxis protein n=1 Tax=Herbaspirillum rhizosphaerae TaxID=346179 RepID=A0ABW8Z1W2_9BURK